MSDTLDTKLTKKQQIATMLIAVILEFERIPGNEAGGNLHIVLDEGNYHDNAINLCLEFAKESNDFIGVQIAEWLLFFSEEERDQLCNFWAGNKGDYWLDDLWKAI